ncbi:MAG: transposase [Saccharofermentanales bacterium]|jgi:transposase InsO family protein
MNKLDLSQQRLKNRRIVQMNERPGQPTKPNQIWEMDMIKTYINGYGWLYIMAIIDRVLQVDNGCQPTSHKFVKELSTCDVALLYSVYATPEQNAHIERFFRTLKEEELYYKLHDTCSEAITSIEAYIDFYTGKRIHSALGYITPAKYYQQSILQNVA